MDQEEDLLNSLLAVATEELDKLDNNKCSTEQISEKIVSENSRTASKCDQDQLPKRCLKETDLFQFETNLKLPKGKKTKSIIHSGDTDSSDDEANRNYEEQKYNEYGREIKSILSSSSNSALDANSISSNHYGVPKKRVSTWKSKPPSTVGDNNVQPSINSKTMFGKTPDTEKKIHDVFIDPIFGMRIVNPLISSSLLLERMQGRLAVRFSDLSRQIFAGNLKDKDWVVCGVVVNKSPPKTSQKGSQYSIWTLTDLKGDIKTSSLFMFSSAHKDLWKTAVGTVIGVLNPNIMDRKDGSKDEACLSVDNAQRVMIFGHSKDFGVCKSIKKDGQKCTAIVNLGMCEYCIYHIKQEYQKSSKRSELQANFAGQGLVNLRNKVLGKNEVFYAGKSYMAVPAKKSKKLEARDNSILQNLSGMSKTSSSIKTKNVTQKKKGVARQLDVNPAQRARDLKLLEKLGGTTSLEKKTNFSGTRSDEVSLEDSKATALNVIGKLKAKKVVEEPINKTSQYNLKGDLFVSVESKKTFSGSVSNDVSLEESKNKALEVISKLKSKSEKLKKNKDSDNENLLSLEEIESQINCEELNYSDNNLDDDKKTCVASDQTPTKEICHKNEAVGRSGDLIISKSNVSSTKSPSSQKTMRNNCIPLLEKTNAESFGSIFPKLSRTAFNLNNTDESRSFGTPKSASKNNFKRSKNDVGLKPNNFKQKFSDNLAPENLKNDCPSLFTTSSINAGNGNKSYINTEQIGCHSLLKEKLNLTNTVPRLSGFGQGDFIDLSKPIRSLDRAKLNAVKLIQKNGPIKKVDPNSTKGSGAKKRKIESVLESNSSSNNVTDNLNEESISKKSKLQKSEFISDRFKKMMAMTSKHAYLLEHHDNQEEEKYFKKLEVKEKMEEKMTNTHKVKCKAVKCLQCKYTSFSASELCKTERHPLKVFDAMKRFYKCANCQNRTVTLELIPTRPCNNCGSSKWEKTGMMKEKIALVQHNLSIRGGEQKFVNSVVTDANLDLLVPDDQ